MTYERRVVQTDDPVVETPIAGTPVVAATPVAATTRSEVVTRGPVGPSGGELARRAVILIFGIIQILIVLRIVLLLLNAREGNELVSFILNTSQIFVSPFNGIFNKDALASGGSILDIAAIAALVGWTVLEVIVLWAINLFRRETVV